jgi:hypothetical protein
LAGSIMISSSSPSDPDGTAGIYAGNLGTGPLQIDCHFPTSIISFDDFQNGFGR